MKKEWLKLVEDLYHAEQLSCPNCKKNGIDYLYVGDEETRIGYLQIWCTKCKKGVYISRVNIPANVKFVTFEESKGMNLPIYDFL